MTHMIRDQYFILNKHAHYFVVYGDIEPKNLEDCDLFSSLDELLLAAAQISNVEFEVVNDNVYSFKYNSEKGLWTVHDPSDYSMAIITENTIENFLSDWSL